MKKWIDENGLEIPVSRITPLEKKRERFANKLAKQAMPLHKALKAYKKQLADYSEELWIESLQAEGATGKKSKGNYTWYNFDRSIKIEKSINDLIEFDDVKMAAAKELLDNFLNDNTATLDAFFREIITGAFSTTKGKLDSKKVFELLRHKSKAKGIKYEPYHRACDLIQEAIRRPESREYHRISILQEDGSYQAINLNFSSI